ncbi:zeta toxin family protein [Nocardiopsis sp. NPDC007018]|uniref:zeta toxin family protein n=1 Tax=Nocardiopsis sp. NPDC007018 TaxID=3155721 RepID=UPI003402B77E
MFGRKRREAEIFHARKRTRIENLVPADAPNRRAGERPQLVLVTGQPGAGKSTVQRNVVCALGPSAASYDSDDNAEIHPRYTEIMREYGLQGQTAVERELPGSLHGELLGHLCGATGGPKYDVVASFPFARPEGVTSWLRPFSARGYGTTVVFTATHESNSVLGIAHRYQKDRDDALKGYGRWVEPTLHDVVYAESPPLAHALESTGRVDHIYVVNRDAEVLYENHRGADGTMSEPLGAAKAIVQERIRAPTPKEIKDFDSAVAYMRSTDPEVRPLPLEAVVTRGVYLAEMDHLDLRRRGKRGAEPRKTLGAALEEQLRQAPGSERSATAAKLSHMARKEQPSPNANGPARRARGTMDPGEQKSNDMNGP